MLSIGVVVAAIAGWHLPSQAPDTPAAEEPRLANTLAPAPGASNPGTDATRIGPSEPAPAASAPPLPPIDERELVPYSPEPAKPARPKRAVTVPKAVVPPTAEAPAEIEIVAAPPPAPTPPRPAPRADPWRQMNEAIAGCPDGFLAHVVCEQRIRLTYCEGHWGQVPQCPGGPGADHN